MSPSADPWIATERFARSTLENVLEGITDAEALRAPAPGLNTVNWVAGHILAHRDRVHQLLELESAWPAALGPDDEYRRGATGRLNESAPSLRMLRQALDRSFGAVLGALETQKQASVSLPNSPATPVSVQLSLYAAHDWYHIGQLAMLRRLLGKPAASGRMG